MTNLKVGDELIIHDIYGYKVYPIEKITHYGRIICGGYVLNPDLTLLGPDDYHPIYSVTIVTGDAIAQMKEYELRNRLLFQLEGVYFPNLKTEQLQKISEILFPKEVI